MRRSYGGEFGQRCLLARRLVQGGVRFVEVSHNLNFINGAGWDVHNEGIDNQHILIRELDHALAGLIEDLKRTKHARQDARRHRHRVRTSAGIRRQGRPRPPGHRLLDDPRRRRPEALRRLRRQTDDLSKTVVKDPVSIPDFHATILAALNVDTSRDLMAGSRPVPVTDGGKSRSPNFSKHKG